MESKCRTAFVTASRFLAVTLDFGSCSPNALPNNTNGLRSRRRPFMM